MAQRQKVPAQGSVVKGNGDHRFPAEALEQHDEVTTEEVRKFQEKVGIDFSDDEWETIDGFGEVIHA